MPTPESRGGPQVAPILTPAVFHLLLALARGGAHGYALMREVERMTAGRTSVGRGTLDRSVRRMLRDGLVVGRGGGGAGAADERRRVYRMMEFGARVLRAEARRLAALVDAALERGVLPPPARAAARRGAGRRRSRASR